MTFTHLVREHRPILSGLAIAIAVVVLSTQHSSGQEPAIGARTVVVGQTPSPVQTGLQLTGPTPVRVTRTITRQTSGQPPDAAYVPGSVIVKFSGAVVVGAAQRAAMRAMGGRSIEYPTFGNFAVLELEDGVDAEAVAAELNARSDVEYAQPDYLRPALFVPNDSLYTLQWNLMQVGLPRAWDINPGATAETTVAVIDSGLAFEDIVIQYQAGAFTLDGVSYPALGTLNLPFAAATDLVSPNRIVSPFDFVWNDELPVDTNGHGSHVAGTIGQLTNNGDGAAGVAFNVRIMPLKVLADEWDFIFGAVPACCGALDSDVAAAIRYATQFGADVINLSLGGPDMAPALLDAIQSAVSEGVFVAIAAGNSFEDGNAPSYPAVYAEDIGGAMAVGAVDRDSGRAYYSNTGSYVEITAPGGDQRADAFDGVLQQTLDPQASLTFLRPPSQYGPPRFDILSFVFFEGTSMASPHVAGLAALLISQGVIDPAAVEFAIRATATDLGTPGQDPEFGAGLIDTAATLRGLGLSH